MNRPKPRQSSLAGASPVTPPVEKTDAPESSAAQRVPTTAPKAKGSESKYRPKVSFYQDKEDTDRMRAALLHTMATEGHRSLTHFINEAVLEKVERLEKKYNGGQPFGAVGARELPQGRPLGE